MTPDPFITSAGSLSLHVAVVDGGSGDVEAYYWVVIGATGLRKFKANPRGVVQAAVSELGKHFPVARGLDNMRTSGNF